MFNDDLKRLQNRVVSIFTNRDDIDVFSCGYIEAWDDLYIYMNHISPTGDEDGLIIRRLDDIFKIEHSREYENKIEKLFKLKQQEHKKYFADESHNPDNLLMDLLKNAQKSKTLVTFALGDISDNSDLTGFINEFTDEKIYLSIITDNGEENGESIFLLEDICKINCDSQDERSILLLFNNH